MDNRQSFIKDVTDAVQSAVDKMHNGKPPAARLFEPRELLGNYCQAAILLAAKTGKLTDADITRSCIGKPENVAKACEKHADFGAALVRDTVDVPGFPGAILPAVGLLPSVSDDAKQFVMSQVVLMAWKAGKVSEADAASFIDCTPEKLNQLYDVAVQTGVDLIAAHKKDAAFASN